MSNPFNELAPDDGINRIHAFARDLAYGAAQGHWHTRIQWRQILDPGISDTARRFELLLRPKWGTNFPSEYLLVSFGYFEQLPFEGSKSAYLLTQKAFDLLATPTTAPNVFISYRRSESSTFALLVEARLKMAGNPNPFVDKNIPAGAEWAAHLEEQIRKSRYFVLLIGPTTLDSEVVHMEIDWAMDAGCQIISLWHNGATINDSVRDDLRNRHAIFVQEESALSYETTVTQLLNSMGYTTY